MTDETNTDLADGEATQEAITTNPVLSIPDQVPTDTGPYTDHAATLASALSDILPTYWDSAHPSANLLKAARKALDEYTHKQCIVS